MSTAIGQTISINAVFSEISEKVLELASHTVIAAGVVKLASIVTIQRNLFDFTVGPEQCHRSKYGILAMIILCIVTRRNGQGES